MTGISRQRAAEAVAQMFGSVPERIYDYYDTWAVEDAEIGRASCRDRVLIQV